MATNDPFAYDLFISYNSADRAWVGDMLLPRLEATGLCVCIDFRDFVPGAPSISEMERAVLTSRKTLLVLTPAYLASAWGEFEHLLLQTMDPAKRERRLIPLCKDPCDLPLRIKYLTAVDFTDPQERELAWRRLLTALDAAVTPAMTVPPLRPRRDYYEHLKYPPHYLPRLELIAQVRQPLVTGTGNAALTSAVQADALHGMGGIGKTVMARALCDDPTVRSRFGDGILVATLGSEAQEADLRRWLREWIGVLGGVISETAPSLTSLSNTLSQELHDRTCLLIVDDVWRKEQVEPFLAGGPRCRLLLTTRDAELARDLGASILPVPLLDEAQAVQLLEAWATPDLAIVVYSEKAEVVQRLGRLALAVRLDGVQLRSQPPAEWLATFDVRLLQARRVSSKHDSLAATLSLSLEALDPMARRLYATLVIFREDEPTPLQAVVKLWQGLAGYSARASRDLLYDLQARALLEVNQDDLRPGASGTVKLHDLLRDLLSTSVDTTARAAAHQALLTAYRSNQRGAGWHTAVDDGYLYNHLVYHLAALADQQPAALAELYSNQNETPSFGQRASH